MNVRLDNSTAVSVSIEINGVVRTETVEPRMLLVHLLRDRMGMTGTHIGCDTSQCGACTVWLDGEAIKSCSILAVQADGHKVTTIEGLASGQTLHPMQEAFHEEHALQCGYCTPGFIMSSVSLLRHHPEPTDEDLRHGLEGNICRCTGYVNILKAVRRGAKAIAETDQNRGDLQ